MKIERIVKELIRAREQGNTVFVFGNGGSSSTASHFVCDLVKACNIKAICLSDNTSYFSAYANDISYESVFSAPLSLFLKNNDIVIGISCSGNSKNVIRAFELIRQIRDKRESFNALTIAFTGFDGGKLKTLADIHINVPVESYRISEDIHLALCHLIVERILSNEP